MGFVALRGRLLPGASTEYKRAHDQIPRDVIDAQRASGLRRWLIFQDGLDLIHVAESQDFDESIRVLARHPADQDWQRQMAALKQPLGASGNTECRLQLIYERDLWLP